MPEQTPFQKLVAAHKAAWDADDACRAITKKARKHDKPTDMRVSVEAGVGGGTPHIYIACQCSNPPPPDAMLGRSIYMSEAGARVVARMLVDLVGLPEHTPAEETPDA